MALFYGRPILVIRESAAPMLSVLSIRDIVLITQAELNFAPGLCVLTGETGAGKSILLDALGLATGARAEKRLVRHGVRNGAVTAVFHVAKDHPALRFLDEYGLAQTDDEPGTVMLRRVVSTDGPSRAFVNDQPVGVGALQEIGASLLEIHGQHDDRGLLDPSSHRELLDLFAGLNDDVSVVSRAYEEWRDAQEAYDTREAAIAQARSQADYLRHVVSELDALDPQADEEDQLASERSALMSAEKVAGDIEEASKMLAGDRGLETKLNAVLRRLERARPHAAGRLDDAITAFDRALTEVSEARAAFDAVRDSFEVDQGDLNRAEERLFALRAAARKHSVHVGDLAKLRASFQEQWSALETGEADLVRLAEKSEAARKTYLDKAQSLSKARTTAAARLDKAVMSELVPLKLEKAQLCTSVDPLTEDKAGPGGLDQVRFLVATNPGAPFGPLTQIASGGELSRFILVLKVVLAAQGPDKVLIFDEIDRGVGGAVAEAVGERLAALAGEGQAQVLTVTHSPQVAAAGRHHWRIAKTQKGGNTSTQVVPLSEQERQEEVARMLAGAKVTDEARAAAAKLLKNEGAPVPKKRARRS
jgi:DNA repair protein RecN (Recombination protein N)